MEKTIIASAILIAFTLQWQAHYAKDTVSFWTDFLPIFLTMCYLMNKFWSD